MGLKDTFSNFFGLGDEEDYEYEDDYYEVEESKKSEPVYTAPKETVVKSTTTQQAQPTSMFRQAKQNKVVSMNAGSQQAKIVVFEPRVYSEAKEIASIILNHQAVIVNFSRISEEQAARIVDFLTGTVYAVNGDIKRIGEEIFLCTPVNVEIDGINLTATEELF